MDASTRKSGDSADSSEDDQLDEIVRALAQARPMRPPAEFAHQGDRWGDGGRYVIKGILGRGGMGIVYRAFDVEMDREVALKTLPDLVPSEIVILKEEFRVLAGVTHESLIELYDLVVHDDEAPDSTSSPRHPQAFFTMELLDGHDVVTHVHGHSERADTGGQAPSEGWLDRLAKVLPQLTGAVSALHRAGKLHRDIKPSNVWVTANGRLVLLDFGLAIALAGAGRDDTGADAAGTLAYMAPEQIERRPLSPATDWYAVGEVLYEVLTGAAAFGGSKSEIIDAKSRGRLRSPGELVEHVPPPLDALTMGLLHPDATQRASEDDVARTLRTLGFAVADDRDTPPPESPFVGREPELSALVSAFEQCSAGAPVLIRVEGASGIGKTELVRHITGALESAHEAVVLHGRCHPQESVPYKAFDAIVDGLSRVLARLPREDAARLAPRSPGALLRVFPALETVTVLRETREERQPVEPHERRRRGFEALGELLSALARERPTVLWIDDLQWGDADSLLLLRELLGAAGPALFVVGYRSEDLEQGPFLAELDRAVAVLPTASSRRIRLAPLGEAPSRALAASILGQRSGEDAELVDAIVAEAAGSPFFIAELARHAARTPGSPPPAVPGADGRLAGVIYDRLERLRPDERRLLEIVSIAGGPLDRSLVLAAAGLGERGRPSIARLGQACLLRTARFSDRPTVETYHDRIGEALVVGLPLERRRQLHRDLANAMRAAVDPDPEALFRHYLGADELHEAARFVVAAADRARGTLAFDRAAELYQQALGLGVPDRARLLESLGECLVNAGRGADAPPHFLVAAEGRSADPVAAFSLRRQAAEQLIRTGRVDEGTAIFQRVLADVGVTMPRSSRAASLRAAFGLLRVVLRGLDHDDRPSEGVPAQVLRRLDALWGACGGLGVMNPPLGSALAVQHLLEALEAGEPTRLAYALLYEAVLEAAIGGRFFRRRAAKMLALGEELAERIQDPTLRGFKHMARGQMAWHQGRFGESLRSCGEAIRVFDSECRGTAWHHVATENYALSALAFLGDMRTLSVRRRAAIDSGPRSFASDSSTWRLSPRTNHRGPSPMPIRSRRAGHSASTTTRSSRRRPSCT
jgi:serine/threonine protein kinase